MATEIIIFLCGTNHQSINKHLQYYKSRDLSAFTTGVRSVGTIRGNLFLVRMRGLPSTIDDWRRIVRLQSGLFH